MENRKELLEKAVSVLNDMPDEENIVWLAGGKSPEGRERFAFLFESGVDDVASVEPISLDADTLSDKAVQQALADTLKDRVVFAWHPNVFKDLKERTGFSLLRNQIRFFALDGWMKSLPLAGEVELMSMDAGIRALGGKYDIAPGDIAFPEPRVRALSSIDRRVKDGLYDYVKSTASVTLIVALPFWYKKNEIVQSTLRSNGFYMQPREDAQTGKIVWEQIYSGRSTDAAIAALKLIRAAGQATERVIDEKAGLPPSFFIRVHTDQPEKPGAIQVNPSDWNGNEQWERSAAEKVSAAFRTIAEKAADANGKDLLAIGPIPFAGVIGKSEAHVFSGWLPENDEQMKRLAGSNEKLREKIQVIIEAIDEVTQIEIQKEKRNEGPRMG